MKTGTCDQCKKPNRAIAKTLPSSGKWCVFCNKQRLLDLKLNSKSDIAPKETFDRVKNEGSVLKGLVKELDTVFSVFIRTRNVNEAGMGICCTCGSPIHWKQAHCGHLYPRGSFALRWDMRNAHLQCPACNLTDDGMFDDHYSYSLEVHGKEAMKELESLKNKVVKLDRHKLMDDIEMYRNLNKQSLSQ